MAKKEGGHGGGGGSGGHGGGGGSGGHGGGGGGGGGHSVEKAKAAVESALSATEIAAYNVLPVYEAGRALLKNALAGSSASISSAYLGGLVMAFGYSFIKEMLVGVLGKLGGGGH